MPPYRSIWVATLLSLTFLSPVGSASAPDSRLLVSSRNTNSVKMYDASTGQYLGDLVAPDSAGLSAPQEVALGPDGNLYVTARGNNFILRFNPTSGAFIDTFSSGYALDNPTKMTFGPDGKIYVSQWGTSRNKVPRFDAASGAFVDEFTRVGLNQACGHAWDADTNLYVASFGSADVKKFDRLGDLVGVFTEAGKLRGAVNLWFGENGDLFVLDWTLGSVLCFDGQTGAFKSTFISGLKNAEGLAFDTDGRIYICDWSRNQINRYERSGAFIDVFASSGEMRQPNSLVFTPLKTPVERNPRREPKKQ